MKIYHNPRCSKSWETLKLLKDHDLKPEVIEYLKTPPRVPELKEITKMLGVSPIDIVRTKESIWKEQYADRALSDQEVLNAIAQNPVLLERPIVVSGKRAVIGRPPERVLALF